MISDKVNVFCPIGGVENISFNKVPWGRWWGGRILGLWWRRGKLFIKEVFRRPLLPDDREPIDTIEGLRGNGCKREENGFV